MRLRWVVIQGLWLVLTLACELVSVAAEKKPDAEMSKGDVRVILLRAGNALTTNKEPFFEVTYAVEVPKKGAFGGLHFGKSEEVTLSANGAVIKGARGVSSLSAGIETLPGASELAVPTAGPEKAILGQHVEFAGLKVKEEKIDITIRFDWQGRPLEFPFKGVAVK
jgi:hypothetical protein